MNYTPPPNKQHFNEQVWALVRKVPHGKVATYGQITKILPQPEGINEHDYKMSASRWVGLAMGACPTDVPWHRVVNSQGKISHEAEAVNQKQRLEAEGIVFSKVKIDLDQYQWCGPGQVDTPKPFQGQLF